MHTQQALRPIKDWKDYEQVEKLFPALWKRCYPRRYDEPGKAHYDTPKAVARAMMDAFISYHACIDGGRHPGQTEQNEALWASIMAKYTVPTYYLTRDLAVALTHTTPTEVLDCENIHLPFEAAAFMLPKGVLDHGEYGPVAFIGYVRTRGGTEVVCPHPRPGKIHTLTAPEGTFSFSVFARTSTGIFIHWTYDHELRRVDLKDEAELIELQKQYSHTSTVYSPDSQAFTPHDTVTMVRAIKMVFNIILFLTYKPETVEPARLIKRVKKGPGETVEYWMPHIIGRNYKLRYERHEPGGGTHASPRGHWVSGFWREQAYGPKHSLRKPMFIDPFWRGGEIE